MTLKEIKDIKSENDNSLIRSLLSNQKILGEELLEEKKERLARLEKLTTTKTNFLANCSSTSLVITNNNSNQNYCNSCGGYHCRSYTTTNNAINSEKKLNEHYLETAITCKRFLLEDKCNELAKELFDKSFEQIKSLNSAKSIFDLIEKIHKCKESIKILEITIADSGSQEQQLEAKVEALTPFYNN
jgi:hypothetical protein